MDEIKMIVVDDDKDLVKAFSRLIHSLPFNYKTAFFVSPVEALEAIKNDSNSFDLVFSDVRMPEMDGLSFVRAVRKLRPKLPVVFMSAFSSADITEEVNKLGHVVFLEKPFHLKEVLSETIPKLLKT